MEIVIIIIAVFILMNFIVPLLDRRTVGERGEDGISEILARLSDDNITVFNDVIIKNNNWTSQIDHVIISNYGIFVIETKTYKGWIFGSEENERWMQVFFTERFNFYNPILQNRGHIKALKNIMSKYPIIPYYSIVVMAGSCEFKTFNKVTTPVIYPSQLRKTIRELSTQKFLTDEQVAEIKKILGKYTVVGKEYKELHIQNARNKAEQARNKVKSGKCPRCGGVLVERNGKFGNFYGCSNYPKCKFTQNIPK